MHTRQALYHQNFISIPLLLKYPLKSLAPLLTQGLYSLGLTRILEISPRGPSLFPVFPLCNQLQPIARLVFLKGFLPPHFLPQEPTRLSQDIQVLILLGRLQNNCLLIPPSFPLGSISDIFFESDLHFITLVIPFYSVLLCELFLFVHSSNADILRAQFCISFH